MARTLGDAFVRVRPDASRFATELAGDLRRAFAQASRGSSDVLVAADTSRLPRQLDAGVRSAATAASRRGSGDVVVGATVDRLPRQLEAGVREAATRAERSGAADVEVQADTAKFERDLPSRVGATARRAAGVAAAAFAAGAGLLVTASSKAASAQEQSFGAADSVFGDASARVKELAREASTSVGLASADYAQLSAVLASQLKNMGTAQDDLAPASQRLIGLGADLSSTFGGTVADAVGAVSSLLRGERDPIEAYGVSIKQVDIDARLAASGMDKLEGAALTQATTQATLALLFEQTAAAQGQFSREANTAAGVQERLRAQSTNLSATLGTALTPAVVSAGQAASETLLPSLQRLAEVYAPKVAAVLSEDVVPAVQGFFAGLQGSGPVDGFSGKLNTAGLGVRAFFAALQDGDVTSDGFVGSMERAGVKVGQVVEVLQHGGEQAKRAVDVARAAFAGEDVTTVGWLGRVGDLAYAARDGVDAIAAFDWSSLGAAIKGAAGEGESLGPSLSSIASSASELLPFVVELIRSVPSLSDVLNVAAPVFAFLADHVDTLIQIMPLLVGALIAVKVAQAAANLAAAAGVPLRVLEIASNQRHTAALAANTAALNVQAASSRGAAVAEATNTAAKNGGIVATLRSTAATVAARVVQVAATVATGAMAAAQWALNAAMTANPIGIVIALVAALVAGLVFAYRNSETFRGIVDGALRAVAAAGKYMWETVLKPVFLALVAAVMEGWRRFEEMRDRLSLVWEAVKIAFREGAKAATTSFLDLVGKIIQGAADAFGWVPGLGPKLQEASDKFQTFKEKVNEQLSGIKDRDVKIKAELDATATALVKAGASPAEAAKRVRNIGRATGGPVVGAGTETSDSIVAYGPEGQPNYRLSNGEWIQNAAAVKHYGSDVMAAINARRVPKEALIARRDGGPVVNSRQSAERFGRAYNARTDVMFEDGSWRPRGAGGTAAGAAAAASARRVLDQRAAAARAGLTVTTSVPATDNFDVIAGRINVATSALADNMRADVAALARVAKAEAAARVATASASGGGPLPAISAAGWMRPGRGGRITSEFGNRRHPLTGRVKLHNGIDVAGLAGSRVVAMQSGRVSRAARVGSYGNFVEVTHGGGLGKTGYAHLAAIAVKVGQQVARGDRLGTEGATGGVTGKHLHQNWWRGGWRNPRGMGVYDLGGLAREAGFLPKATPKPERVLSPRQTVTYDKSLPVLERLVELTEAGARGGGAQTLQVQVLIDGEQLDHRTLVLVDGRLAAADATGADVLTYQTGR